MQYGLLGEKLGHSFSPEIHHQLGEYAYSLFEISKENLPDFLQSNKYAGLNVTIPYKQTVIPYCHQLTPEAQALNAVNTIRKESDGTLTGHNTDFYGFQSMLHHSGYAVSGKKALVLGSGGASSTVCAVLKSLNANITIISRSGDNNYNNLHLHTDAQLIVNTTPIGMYPNNGSSAVDLSIFPALECVMDLIYNPLKTKLLLDAEQLGIPAYNGLWMLVAQAKESAEFFTGSKIQDSVISHIYHNLNHKTRNIILIGMPGCGKTTVGRILAEKTGKRFIDTDYLIEEKAGCAIPEIFSTMGEDYFRQLETSILREVTKNTNQIIATGGGCVTRPKNKEYLQQNGVIIWLQRPISELATDGRPLSRSEDLGTMYHQREPLYRSFSDYTIPCGQPPVQVAEEIIQALTMDVIK